jgi:hypothetical protein
MHPIDFVTRKIAEGNANEIIELLHGFCDRLLESKNRDNAYVYNFANNFLISVTGQLRLLSQDQKLGDDRMLSVWGELGFFGIERDQLPD